MSTEPPRLRGPGGRPLRIAHLTTVDMSLALLLRTELEVDVKVGCDVLGLSAPGPYVEEVEALGVRHVPLPSLTRAWNPALDLRAARELAVVLRTLRLDVLHTHNPKTGVLGRVLGRAARIPVVVNTCHGLWVQPGDRLLKKTFVLSLEALAAQFSHAELYQNADDRRALSRVVPARRSTVVGNGVDLDRFRPDRAARGRFRDQLGVAEDELLVGGVGRLVAEKGVAEFVEVARALAGKARFLWVGPEDGDKPDAFTGRDGAVEFLGARADMADVYAGLDVFVLPSYREGFSRSAMEAAACGTACVLTDIRGCREVGEDGVHLLLVPPQDAPALTAAVGALLLDEPLRRRLAAAALERAREHFDQRRVAAMSLATYAAIAHERGLGWAS